MGRRRRLLGMSLTVVALFVVAACSSENSSGPPGSLATVGVQMAESPQGPPPTCGGGCTFCGCGSPPNQCTGYICDPSLGCLVSYVAAGTPCTDFPPNLCFTAGQCDGYGNCQGVHGYSCTANPNPPIPGDCVQNASCSCVGSGSSPTCCDPSDNDCPDTLKCCTGPTSY